MILEFNQFDHNSFFEKKNSDNKERRELNMDC